MAAAGEGAGGMLLLLWGVGGRLSIGEKICSFLLVKINGGLNDRVFRHSFTEIADLRFLIFGKRDAGHFPGMF